MKRWGLTLCAGLFCGLGVSTWGLADMDEGFQLSQSTPDMVPLLDSLRADNAPPAITGQDNRPSEQAAHEIRSLRKRALGVPQNTAQRVEAGQAAWLLGLLTLHGASGPADPAKARQWFTLSAHYGEPMASAGMAWCALDGCQAMPNLLQAQYWTQRLMPVDLARAAYFQWLIERQMHPLNAGASVGLQSIGAVERYWLERATQEGNVHAMIALGILLAQDHDLHRSLELFERAAPRSEVAAQNAGWIRRRIALEQRPAQAHLPASAGMSPAEATFKAARDYHRGNGVAINYAEAIRLYRQADIEGSVLARRMLALIYSRTTIEGTLDPLWMRQLSDVDLSSVVPQQAAALGASALRRESTGLIDLLPPKWRQWLPDGKPAN